MKAYTKHLICFLCLLIFIASIIIYLKTNIINSYLFLALITAIIGILTHLLTDALFDNNDDDEKEK